MQVSQSGEESFARMFLQSTGESSNLSYRISFPVFIVRETSTDECFPAFLVLTFYFSFCSWQ